MKKTCLFLMICIVILISMISFADQTTEDKEIPILTDQLIEQSIQESIEAELELGTYEDFKEIQSFTKNIEGQTEMTSSVDQSSDHFFVNPIMNFEKVATLTVHEIQHPFNYNLKSFPIAQMVEEAKIRYESIYLDKNSGEKFIIQTRFDGEKFSSGFRSYTHQQMYEILINEDELSEYLSNNGIDEFSYVKFLTYRSLSFSALLVQTKDSVILLPFKINLEDFKYKDEKVIDAQEYFVALNAYFERKFEEQNSGDGEKRLGGSSLNDHHLVSYLVTLIMVIFVLGLFMTTRKKNRFFKR